MPLAEELLSSVKVPREIGRFGGSVCGKTTHDVGRFCKFQNFWELRIEEEVDNGRAKEGHEPEGAGARGEGARRISTCRFGTIIWTSLSQNDLQKDLDA